ncbi:MAG: helix-turn-helix domain-containing protein [Sphingomonas fennica]
MAMMERFATADVAPAERLGFWNALVDEIYAGTRVDAAEGYRADMWRWQVGELGMIRPRASRSTVRRRDLEGASADRLVIHLQQRGLSRHSQAGRSADAAAGDFVVEQAGEPYAIDLSDGHELLVVELPRAPLAARVAGIDDRLGRRISGRSPGGRLFHDFLLSLWRQGDQSQADPDWQRGVAEVFYDLAALALRPDPALPAAPAPDRQRQRLHALVEARLGDPDLRTGSMAAELGISVRSLQNLFAQEATTPTAFVLDRRLRRAAERLSAETGSITAIAFDLGFNDSAYFARCFRHRFGMSPSAWRAQG